MSYNDCPLNNAEKNDLNSGDGINEALAHLINHHLKNTNVCRLFCRILSAKLKQCGDGVNVSFYFNKLEDVIMIRDILTAIGLQVVVKILFGLKCVVSVKWETEEN